MRIIAALLLLPSLCLGAQTSPGYQPTANEMWMAQSIMRMFPFDHDGMYGLFYRSGRQAIHPLDAWRTFGGQPVTTFQELGFHRSEAAGRGCPESDKWWPVGCLWATAKHTPTRRISLVVLGASERAWINATRPWYLHIGPEEFTCRALGKRMIHESMHMEADAAGIQLWTHDTATDNARFYAELDRRYALWGRAEGWWLATARCED